MKKTFFYIAAFACAVLSSCQVEFVQPTEESTPSTIKTYSISLGAALGSDTKALNVDGKSINASWAAGDKVAVYVAGYSTPVGTLEPAADRKSVV